MKDEPILEVRRASRYQGFWIWRRADYVVYQRQPDGNGVEVFTGRFRSGRAALQAARAYLDENQAPP